MAILKVANAEVIDIITAQAWQRMQGKSAFRNKTAAAAVVEMAKAKSRYMLNHCAIMASVMTEDEPQDWLIKPESSALVNQNQDAWENTVLAKSYASFRGAFNFVEHYQNTKASKGHILDAILRKVHLNDTVWVYYVDLLVATDLAHEELITDIRSGKTKYMSMGCLTDIVICSFCGQRCADSSNFCDHLAYSKGEFIFDEAGVPRRVAELCGHKSLPNGGVRFLEASWVKTPAFAGASYRSLVADNWEGPKPQFAHTASIGQLKVASGRAEDAQLRVAFDRLLR